MAENPSKIVGRLAQEHSGASPQRTLTVGRFAPSPSGRMHLGNALAALLAWLGARSAGGRLILRIEDLDRQRCKPEYAQKLMEDLVWMGLDWDEGPQPGQAPTVEYWQSRRTDFYEQQLQKLEEQGLLYPCFCTRAQLHAQNAPHADDGTSLYDGRCAALTPRQAAEMAQTRPGAVRLRVPDKTVALQDLIQGPYAQNLKEEVGDFLLRRSDGMFAYQLAVCADDGAMGVTQVVRGRDLLSSAPRQIWLMETLGYAPPQYAHLPLLLAPDGRRLAKREQDLDMSALRQRLRSPERLVGLLAHWAGLLPAPQATSTTALLPLFRWDKINKENIKINPEKIEEH